MMRSTLKQPFALLIAAVLLGVGVVAAIMIYRGQTEAGPPVPPLTTAEIQRAVALAEADARVVARISGRPYKTRVGRFEQSAQSDQGQTITQEGAAVTVALNDRGTYFQEFVVVIDLSKK